MGFNYWGAQNDRSTLDDPNGLKSIMEAANTPVVPTAVAPQTVATPPQNASLGVQNGAQRSSPYWKKGSDSGEKHFQGETNVNLLDPKKLDAVLKYWRSTPEAQSQREGQAGLYNLLSMEAGQPSQVDLSPLADAANYATTGVYKSTKKYENPKDMRDAILKYGEKAQDNQRDVYNNIIKGVQASKGGTIQDLLTNELKSKFEQGLAPPKAPTIGSEYKPFDAWTRVVDRDHVMKNAGELNKHIEDAMDMLNRNGPVDAQDFRVPFLKALGITRVTDTEMKNTQGGKGWADTVEQKVNTLIDQQGLTEKNRDQYRAILKDVKARFAQSYNTQKRILMNRGKSYGLSDDVMSTSFSPQYGDSQIVDTHVNPINIGAPKKERTDAEVEAELKKRGY